MAPSRHEDGGRRGDDGGPTALPAPLLDGPLDLEPVVRWCHDVLDRADDGLDPAVLDGPPLPASVHDPLVRHGFDAFDETVIGLALGPDLDPVLGLRMAARTEWSSSPYPTLALLADLVGALGADRVALATRLSDGGPLVRSGLLHVVPSPAVPVVAEPSRGPTMLATCVASTALLRWTFGVTQLEPALFPHVRDELLAPATPPDPACAEALGGRLASDRPSLTSLAAGSPSDALATALYAAARCGRPVLTVDASALVEPAPAARVAAEAMLRGAVVVVTGDAGAVPRERWETLLHAVVVGIHPATGEGTSHDVAALVVHRRQEVSVGSHLVDVLRGRGLGVAPAEAARMSWWSHLRYEDVGRLAATLEARARGRLGPGRAEVSSDDVTSASVGVVGSELARLATPLETSRDWSHLVLPGALRRDLTELIDQAAARTAVLAGSGFAAVPGLPRGVTAVFAGPSGTGKTHAARLVAGELGLPLYAVNLAATVSKYIGETERNLDAVFAAAEHADAVLLFDEAEALFGKRSETRDAHDRYANLEIAFLLQRMERYDGVAVLATNLLANFDDAFARRVSFCLRFPYPDAAQRALIWRAVWPAEVRLAADVRLDELAAEHPLSGGHIRNIAFAATHLARARGGPVDRVAVERAVEREYAKLGQVAEALAGAAL